MSVDKKKLRNDIILIASLLLVAIICLVIISLKSTKNNLVARISVQDTVVETIDLSKSKDKDYYIDGIHGVLHVHTHEGAIAVLESNCPHQDCVKMGYVNDSSHPIICAYNGVSIEITGEEVDYDVEIG